MQRGEIWRVRLPISFGHAQTGERPALIIQNDAASKALPTTLIVPFTGSAGAGRLQGTILVQPDSTNGLTKPSFALVFQIRVVDKGDCLYPIGSLDQPTLDQIHQMVIQLTS